MNRGQRIQLAYKVLLAGLAGVLSVGCRPDLPADNQLIFVPQSVPNGTTINTQPLGKNLPRTFAVALVSDCDSCSASRLQLPRSQESIHLFIVTAHKNQLVELRSEWKGVPVVSDEDMSILPAYCYTLVPRLLLIEGNAVKDSAVGAVECKDKWRQWNG